MSPQRAAVRMEDNETKVIETVASKADMPVSKVEQRVEDELAKLQDNLAADIGEDELRSHAVSIVKNDLLHITSSGFGGGEAEELSVLALGYQRKESNYFVTDGDALVALGITNPRGKDDPGLSIFLLDENHGVDLDHTSATFQPLNTIRAVANRRAVGEIDGEPEITKGGKPTYLMNSTRSSKFEEVNPEEADDSDPLSELPSDLEAKRDLINEHFITDEDVVTLQNYPEHETRKRGDYEVAFGIDIKRFRGEVVDVYSNDNGFGVMTMMDNTVFDQDDVPEELVSDKMRTPGLQIFGMPPELLQYGERSMLDVYGFIEQTDEGQYRMQGFGIIPIVAFDRDESGKGGTSSDIDEDVIGG